MKKILGIVVALVIVLSSCKQNAKNTSLKTENDSLSYFIGVYFASQAKTDIKDLNIDAVTKGFMEVYEADTFKMNPTEVQIQLNRLFEKMMKKAGEKNKVESQKFLDENKKKSGVITLPSGLQYKVIKEGTGPMADSTDVVSVNYVGKFIDGKVFDSNPSQKFPVVGVIPGFTEALLKMKVGSKWEIVIPSELAYGEQGRGQIKPNTALIFELEVLGIDPKQPEQPSAPQGKK